MGKKKKNTCSYELGKDREEDNKNLTKITESLNRPGTWSFITNIFDSNNRIIKDHPKDGWDVVK